MEALFFQSAFLEESTFAPRHYSGSPFLLCPNCNNYSPGGDMDELSLTLPRDRPPGDQNIYLYITTSTEHYC